MMLSKKNTIAKIGIIILGSLISALGIDLAIHAGFGGATLAVLWMGLSHTLGITIGQASMVVAALMILFCFFYDRRQIYYGTILYQVFYSFATDWFAPYMKYTGTKSWDFLLMVLGIVLFAFGTALYSYTDWGRGSYEALTFALVEKHGWKTGYVRTSLDFLVVVLGILLGGQFGLCTVFTILLSGYLIQRFLKALKSIIPMEKER